MIDKNIYVMRHGRTRWNAEGKLQGRLNSPLLDSGVGTIKAIARYIADQCSIDKVYCSPLRRSLESAEIVCSVLAVGYEEREELMECDMGMCEGLTWQEAQDIYTDFFTRRKREKWTTAWPNGESYLDVYIRAQSFLQWLPCDILNVLIIGHETFNKCFLGACMQWSPDEIMSFKQANHDLFVVRSSCKSYEKICFNEMYQNKSSGG